MLFKLCLYHVFVLFLGCRSHYNIAFSIRPCFKKIVRLLFFYQKFEKWVGRPNFGEFWETANQEFCMDDIKNLSFD